MGWPGSGPRTLWFLGEAGVAGLAAILEGFSGVVQTEGARGVSGWAGRVPVRVVFQAPAIAEGERRVQMI